MERQRHAQFCLPAYNDLLQFLFQYCLQNKSLHVCKEENYYKGRCAALLDFEVI